jgi:hypothetical protein
VISSRVSRCCFGDMAASCELEAVRKGLNESGYFEGRNLAIIYRPADSQLEQLPRLATELVPAFAGA